VNPLFWRRLLARSIDLCFAALVGELFARLFKLPVPPLSPYLFYELLAAGFGLSLGKVAVGIQVKGTGRWGLVFRELVLFFFAPWIALSLLWGRPWHDRVCHTQVTYG